MIFYSYDHEILPNITLIGKDNFPFKRKNPNRTSNDYIFYIVTNGELFFNEDNTKYHLKKGDCFLFEPGKHHYGIKESSHSIFYVHFKHRNIKPLITKYDDWLKNAQFDNKQWITNLNITKAPKRDIIIPKTVSFEDQALFDLICNLADKAIKQSRTHLENYDVLCSCAVNELFIEIYRQYVSINLSKSVGVSRGEYICNKLLSYLNNNFHRKLNSDIIETELTYNFDYLNQVFKKNLNTTVFKTLEKIRIENAKIFMDTLDIPLSQIAENVGYDNGSYFSKSFKKHTGISPSAYRKRNNK